MTTESYYAAGQRQFPSLEQQQAWLAAHRAKFPPIRLAASDPSDECEEPIWLDGLMFQHLPEDQRYKPHVKRGPGRPKKHPV